jgi:hypothetical protein
LLVVGVLLYTGDLPRLVNQSGTDGEGARPETGSGEPTTAVPMTTSPGAGGTVGGGVPPTPTLTPPIIPPKAARPREQSYLGRITIGIMLVGLGVLAILDNIPAIALEPQPRHYMALAVTILGLGLIVGGFIGRARWLILLGVVLVPTMLFSPVFEYDWNTESFDRTVAPGTFAELENSYSLDVGTLVIDLSELPWDGEVVELDVRVDAGNIEILIPDEVGVVGEATVDVGRVAGLGRESSGLGNPTIELDEPGALGTVELDAAVDVGNIEISEVGR